MRRDPPKLFKCYPTDNLSCNLRHVVQNFPKSRTPGYTAHYRSNPFYTDVDYDIDDNTASAVEMSPNWLENMSRDLSVVCTSSTSKCYYNFNRHGAYTLTKYGSGFASRPFSSTETGLVAQDSQDDNFMGDVSNAIESAGAISPSREYATRYHL
ncbi:E3 ubiquitin-protein ligase Ubr3 [Eumeta japonica]|uniref:E3 ubiquitin-protein ligase Ubr3 n=1 Tax=Eumeta variegata TaxID=151549 RepID=A0A4C1SVH4_EUMVA|nr:E3 ubiquitin-protein ligase Ubr3 [Eumeta japonica]